MENNKKFRVISVIVNLGDEDIEPKIYNESALLTKADAINAMHRLGESVKKIWADEGRTFTWKKQDEKYVLHDHDDDDEEVIVIKII